MPIYSETLKDDTILDLLENKYQNILIVGCGACMNESLAFKYNYPLFIKDDYGNQISYAVFKELSRITNMLNSVGYTATYEILPESSNSRCMLNYGENLHIISANFTPDAILALCCPSGVYGIKSVVGNVPIIKITKQLGFLAYGYTDDMNGNRNIIKDKSKVIYNEE